MRLASASGLFNLRLSFLNGVAMRREGKPAALLRSRCQFRGQWRAVEAPTMTLELVSVVGSTIPFLLRSWVPKVINVAHRELFADCNYIDSKCKSNCPCGRKIPWA